MCFKSIKNSLVDKLVREKVHSEMESDILHQNPLNLNKNVHDIMPQPPMPPPQTCGPLPTVLW